MSTTPSPLAPGALARFFDGDVWHSFRSSPMAIGSAAVALVCIVCAVFAGWIAPHNPFDLATLELNDSMLPPSWMTGGTTKYLLGTDEPGRDVLSALMYGARISLAVGIGSTALGSSIGVMIGLASGYLSGWVDLVLQRLIDILQALPLLVLALVIFGRWHLGGLVAACLGFGVLDALQSHLQGRGLNAMVPYQLFQALPFIVALLALGALRRGTAGPRELGKAWPGER